MLERHGNGEKREESLYLKVVTRETRECRLERLNIDTEEYEARGDMPRGINILFLVALSPCSIKVLLAVADNAGSDVAEAMYDGSELFVVQCRSVDDKDDIVDL